MDTGAWRAKVHGVTQRWTRLSASAAVAAATEGPQVLSGRESFKAQRSSEFTVTLQAEAEAGENGFGLGMWGERRLKSLWTDRRPTLPLPPRKAPDIVQRGDAVR